MLDQVEQSFRKYAKVAFPLDKDAEIKWVVLHYPEYLRWNGEGECILDIFDEKEQAKDFADNTWESFSSRAKAEDYIEIGIGLVQAFGERNTLLDYEVIQEYGRGFEQVKTIAMEL